MRTFIFYHHKSCCGRSVVVIFIRFLYSLEVCTSILCQETIEDVLEFVMASNEMDLLDDAITHVPDLSNDLNDIWNNSCAFTSGVREREGMKNIGLGEIGRGNEGGGFEDNCDHRTASGIVEYERS